MNERLRIVNALVLVSAALVSVSPVLEQGARRDLYTIPHSGVST